MAYKAETGRRLLVTSLAILAGLGASAIKPKVASAACNIAGQITRLERVVASGETVQQPVLQPAHPKKTGIVKVFDKNERRAESKLFMTDPLILECGGRAVRYAALTNDPRNTLGRRYSTGTADYNGEVYIDVIAPSATTTEADLGLGNAQGISPQDRLVARTEAVRFNDVYERATDQYFPAFVGTNASATFPLTEQADGIYAHMF